MRKAVSQVWFHNLQILKTNLLIDAPAPAIPFTVFVNNEI